eukprot:TRINITY_DN29530_c0_g1_i3.p1 TRINITY_DN29530_c0_g1~~TRINITY_DN29530_c0_g1_i3.p1  ORF type:complete len:241 (-),score=40.94 TRINITY_DN29530_c0_g1_i3:77-799(-)
MPATVVTVLGWSGCPFFRKAKAYATSLQELFPARFRAVIDEAPDRASYRARVGIEPASSFRSMFQEGSGGREHTGCPMVYLGENEYLGGHDAFKAWSRLQLTQQPSHWLDEYERAFFTDDHGALLEMMHPQVVFCDPLLRGKDITDKESLRKYLAQSNGVMSQTVQAIKSRVVDDARGTIALHWEHNGVNAVTKEVYSFPGVSVLCVEAGLVTEHRDFFDPSTLIQQFKRAHKHKSQSKL